MFRASRGGAKPQMILSSSEIYVAMGGNQRKSGMYELSRDGRTIARRVELPTWLSEVVINADTDSLRAVIHAEYQRDLSESRGHIFLRPPRHLFNCPAVGLDVEVFNRLMDDTRILEVQFYIYATDYRLVGIWTISADEFIDAAKHVQTKPQFAPQWMVPLTALTNGRLTTH